MADDSKLYRTIVADPPWPYDPFDDTLRYLRDILEGDYADIK